MTSVEIKPNQTGLGSGFHSKEEIIFVSLFWPHGHNSMLCIWWHEGQAGTKAGPLHSSLIAQAKCSTPWGQLWTREQIHMKSRTCCLSCVEALWFSAILCLLLLMSLGKRLRLAEISENAIPSAKAFFFSVRSFQYEIIMFLQWLTTIVLENQHNS